ncbi:MAG: aminoacyl-tRNA deacylase [Bradyrhizobium sp.]|uniref:aminoacyl-tRNA deacylase n=1 Tax=Bradyrhizobium sp. TaxID=376 RepID=UPI00272FBBEB|nr:aminoacyl-tRNA deacylase [Bradyrhizobium sp.]MDP1869298.1 aminoacyl-tRNA deacylase [Bradyrhizobium sp.]
MSLQVTILKVLASHDSGRAPLTSLNRDIAILSASGAEWSARIRRLAARVAAIDVFGCGYVQRDAEGWQITAAGREFLDALEAVTQDNQPPVPIQRRPVVPEASTRPEGALIVIGHRFKSRIGRHRDAAPRNPRAIQDEKAI